MEIQIQKNRIKITHTLKRNQTYRVQKGQTIESISILNKPQVVSGFSNQTEDNYGILTIDYDGVEESVVLEDYELLQNKFGLPEGYLFKTKKGYHVICLKKFPHGQIPEVLAYTRCDSNYKDMPLRNPYRSYVLRISPKKKGKRPKFMKKIGNIRGSQAHWVSSAHLNLLKKLYPKINFVRYSNQDLLKKIKLTLYETK